MNPDTIKAFCGFLVLCGLSGFACTWFWFKGTPLLEKATDDRIKMFIGTLVVVGLLGLTIFVALGKVEEKTSFGLLPILGSLTTLLGSFGVWVYGQNKKD